MAKKNEMGTVKIMAKDLVRTRNTCKKFMLMRANIQGVSLKMTTIKSQHAMSEAMKGVTRAMGRMNKQMNLPQIQKNHAAIRERIGNHGYEGGDDERRHGACDA